MRAVQKQMLLMPQKEGLEMIDAQQKQMRLQIEHELKGLQQLHSTVLLEPADIHRLAALQTELRMQLLQCELFRQELQQLVQPHLQKRWYVTISWDSPSLITSQFSLVTPLLTHHCTQHRRPLPS